MHRRPIEIRSVSREASHEKRLKKTEGEQLRQQQLLARKEKASGFSALQSKRGQRGQIPPELYDSVLKANWVLDGASCRQPLGQCIYLSVGYG
jgi:hypothetical protein